MIWHETAAPSCPCPPARPLQPLPTGSCHHRVPAFLQPRPEISFWLIRQRIRATPKVPCPAMGVGRMPPAPFPYRRKPAPGFDSVAARASFFVSPLLIVTFTEVRPGRYLDTHFTSI